MCEVRVIVSVSLSSVLCVRVLSRSISPNLPPGGCRFTCPGNERMSRSRGQLRNDKNSTKPHPPSQQQTTTISLQTKDIHIRAYIYILWEVLFFKNRSLYIYRPQRLQQQRQALVYIYIYIYIYFYLSAPIYPTPYQAVEEKQVQ